MANDWLASSLGELTDWASGGTPPKENPEYWGGGIPWISASSMKSGRLSESDRTLTQKGLEQKSRLARKNDVLLVRGSELHKRIPFGVATRDVAFNQDVKALRAKNGISSTYLYYWLTAHEPMLLSKVEHNGIGAGKLDTAVLKALPVEVPPIEEQRAIAHSLGTLDDKIELNRKQNETLEAMARAMFKAWFVDFEPVRAKMEGRWQHGQSLPGLPAHLYDLFPDRLVESELGEIPEGWRVGCFADAVEIIGGGTPKTSVSEYWDGDIPWFSVVDTPDSSDVFVIQTEKSITQAGLNGSSARMIPKGTTIISARGTIGNLAIAGRDMTFNQSCYALRGRNGAGSYFIFLSAQRMVEQLKAMAHGSVFSTITRQTFEAVQAVLPPENVLQHFERSAAGLIDPILGNVNESRSLAQLRDTLLPKLISGELRIADAEAFIKERGL